ncbi:hypothetical protein AH04_108 [Erwinia phage AH04]|uniref:Virion structural protein n=1 Tax=Erwinia phage AH04 TaxID=2869569 RepID=A0AAE8BQ37_9CAUD|nr:hypothetical protein PQC02_gp206 [Erwinia phage AH04]QZA70589.1 hypothetical protein AH04_108 [Erwinia phage AH04]
MIIISDTPKTDVIVSIDKELVYLRGLSDTIKLLRDGSDNLAAVEGYIQRNAVLKGIEGDVRKHINSRSDLIGTMDFAINQLIAWVPKLKDRIIKGKTDTFDVETITFQEKGILDSISAINFFNRYSGVVLDIVITEAGKEVSLNSFLTKVDLAFFNNTPKYYSNLLVKFSQSIKTLDTMIDDLTDEPYDAQSEEILAASVGDKAVSVQRNLAPHQLNPLYWWKRRQMKKDIKTIIDSNADVDMLAMKIARLNNRRSGVEDPGLDRQIEIYQDEIIKKQGKIAQIEARYGN